MNRRGFFGLVAGAFAAIFTTRQSPITWKSKMWHEPGTFIENGRLVTYYPPVELKDGPFIGSQRRYVQFKKESLLRKLERQTRNY